MIKAEKSKSDKRRNAVPTPKLEKNKRREDNKVKARAKVQ